MIELTLKRQPTVPLESDALTPDVLCTLPHGEICSASLYHGRRQCRIDDFFDVVGERSENLCMNGDLEKLRWLGRGMSKGTIQVHGNIGMHLGSQMTGGSIEVSGNAGDWVGAEMRNGHIQVRGNAGGQIGGAYRGSRSGMRNGMILVGGAAGLEVGLRMRRGTIVIGGLVRDFAGYQMKGGTIVLLQGAENRTGAWMNRGTVISLKPLDLMPTFRPCGASNPTFLNVYARHLASFDVQLPYRSSEGAYDRFSGDVAVTGKGEIYIWKPR